MKTERILQLYACDNPTCSTVVRHDPDVDNPLPDGFHGTAVEARSDEDYESNQVEWFACRKTCIRGAVQAAIERDAETPGAHVAMSASDATAFLGAEKEFQRNGTAPEM
jgi:hypothetical protein